MPGLLCQHRAGRLLLSVHGASFVGNSQATGRYRALVGLAMAMAEDDGMGEDDREVRINEGVAR
jgi:hypothetical protein